MTLTTTWYLIIAGLWTGYAVLEGFDFGVGMLLVPLGRDEAGRRAVLGGIGPVWDGNEVWLITAVGATFAAFPAWYAGLLSALYLPVLAILLALVVRGLALEYRGKRPDASWRRRWDRALTAGSALPAALWGLVFATMTRGVPLSAAHDPVGSPAYLLAPRALLGAATTAVLFATHGALFVALKTTGAPRERARRLAGRLGPVALVLLAGFLASGPRVPTRPVVPALLGALALTGLVVGVLASRAGRDGWAFTGTATTVATTMAGLFAGLYPRVLPSTADPAGTLTVHNAAASGYALHVMSWLALGAVPLVLAYQAWTYWVFRRRVTGPPR